MPHMTGLELQQQINSRGWLIPTIFITAHATVPSAVAALRAGAFDFIEKPLRDDTLIESLAQAPQPPSPPRTYNPPHRRERTSAKLIGLR
jgi:FixJ family two-component response regulator